MKKICIVTGTRAEYGLLKGLMKLIEESKEFELQVIAAAMHLAPEYGETYKIIEKDGFKISHKVEMLLSSDTETSTLKSLGLGIIEFSMALDQLKPDLMIVLGDRFEILSACQSAMVLKIPIAHIHGGELTEGTIDDAIRHSITKMSLFHFTASNIYRKRVIQLGEDPSRVFNTGAPGVDNIFQIELLDRKALSLSLEMDLSRPFFLVTYHPVTLEKRSPTLAIKNLLEAMESFEGYSIIFTMPNCDPAGREITKQLKDFTHKYPKRMKFFESLGQLRYLSALKEAEAVVGNSSSGLIEAPALKTPTINIGSRQRGRLCDNSVLNSGETSKDIILNLKKAISPSFQGSIQSSGKLFGDGDATKKIFKLLQSIDISKPLSKKFFDIDFKP